jgi:outer membrane protein assembly factor BamD
MAFHIVRRSRLSLFLPFAFLACGSANPYQGMDAGALFQRASSEFEEGDYDNAIEALERLTLSYSDWPRIPEARLMLGDARFEKGEYITARTEYQRFLDRHSGHPSSPDAALGACRSLAELAPAPERDQGYTDEGIAVCRNVVVDYAGLPQAREAAEIANGLRTTLAEKDFATADFYFRRKLFDSAIIYYERVARLWPETEWAPRALLGIYRSNSQIGYEDLAEEARQRLLSLYPDSESAAEVRGNGTDTVG